MRGGRSQLSLQREQYLLVSNVRTSAFNFNKPMLDVKTQKLDHLAMSENFPQSISRPSFLEL